MKNYLVIGATGDVGQGITAELLRAGHRVIAAARNQNKLATLKSRLQSDDRLRTIAATIENESSATALLATVKQEAAQVDGIIVSVNAPIVDVALMSLPSTQLAEILQTNLVTHLVAARTFIPSLIEGGVYLAIGGGLADFVVPGRGAISMCQAAQRMMFKVLGAELQGRQFRLHELMLHSMIAGESNRGTADPRWITDEDVGRHVIAVLEHPEWFQETILNLKSRKQVAQPPVA